MDQLDRRLLSALQDQGRTPNVELARTLALAPSTTLERVRRLEERGVIKGYRAILDQQALGLKIQALVLINLDHHQAGPIEAFEDRVRAVPEVLACYHLTGRHDYMLHVVVRDIDHLREVVKHRLATIVGVDKQETLLVLSTVKENEGYALDTIIAEDARQATLRGNAAGSSAGNSAGSSTGNAAESAAESSGADAAGDATGDTAKKSAGNTSQ
ncbi:MAG: Lrp/AsnC family transcriptional regulator [Candidatus Eisenbacteria sp.]|nr:Lrp/AsnC family transcriptional regulator [Candidatus Eisenbacteria bacterium]